MAFRCPAIPVSFRIAKESGSSSFSNPLKDLETELRDHTQPACGSRVTSQRVETTWMS